MRLRSIAFAPFGALEDVSIDLGDTRGALHVIYGPNEAGKSTALRGLIGFFFGIPVRTADQHTKGLVLRVRARIELSDGRVIDRVRRKAQKDTLLDGATGAPVADDEIRRWIGGLDEPTFRQLHAIDHVRLREGAEGVLKGRGKIGELLLEASTGATGLADRLERLREEADAIYRPRAPTTALHAAERAWLAASKASGEAMLSVASWEAEKRGIEELRRRVAEIDRELREARADQARLARLASAEDPWVKLRRKRIARADLGPVPDVPEGTAALRDLNARQAAEAAAEAARVEAELTTHRAAAATASRRAAGPGASFDPAAGRAVRARLVQAQAARAEAAAEVDGLDRDLAVAEARLGPPPPARASWAGVTVDARTQATIQSRAAAHRDAARARAAAERALRDARARRERMDGGETEQAEAVDDRSADALAAAIASGRRAAVAGRARDALAAREVELAGRIAAEVASSGAASAEALVAAAAPDADVLALEERERVLAAAELAGLERELSAERERAERAADALEALRGGAGVPDPGELDALRGERDALVEEVATALDAADPGRAAPAVRRLVVAIQRADGVVDRMRHDAARVERAAQLDVERRRAVERARALGARIEERRATLADRDARWCARWPALAGRDAEGARAWCGRRATVLSLGAELEAAHARRIELDREITAAQGALRRALPAGEPAAIATSAPLEADLATAERHLEHLRRRAGERQARESALLRATEELESAEHELEHASAAEREAARLLGEVVEPLGLDVDASHEETGIVAAVLHEATVHRGRREAAAAKLARLDAEIAAATAEWQAAARAAGLEGVSLDDAIARGEAAREGQRDRDRLEEAIAVAEATVRRERDRQAFAEARLAEIRERTGLPLEGLAAAEAASRAARELDRAIEQLAGVLVERLGVTTLAAAEDQVRDVDFQRVADRADEVAAAIAALESRRDHDNRQIGGAELNLRQLGSEGRASELAMDAEAHLARARSLARRAAVARAAVALLEQAIEQHRSEREGPVLRRAADLFRVLTEGAWGGLQVAEAEGGELEIRCLRGGVEHPVSALSQGTADQLYLGLRLAAIEHQARGGVRLPLLLDDVLVHFDAERKLAALRALAEVAGAVQVILFTHERDVADAARAHLGDRAVVHELARRG